MTPFIFLALFAGSVLMPFVRPIWGVYGYGLIFYFSPHRTWWEDLVPDLRYLQLVAIATLAAAMFHGYFRIPQLRRLGAEFKLFALLVVFIHVVGLWAITGEMQTDGRVLFLKHFSICLMMVVLIDSYEKLKNILLVHVLGGLWLGYQALGAGGRVEDLAGALGDSNTLGMHMACLAIIAGLMFLSSRRYHRWLSFLALPFIINAVVLTSSRGATVGLIAGGIVAGFLVPRKILPQFAIAGVCGIGVLLMLADAKFLERIETLLVFNSGDTEEINQTSGNRVEIALAGFEMWKDHPMGTGYKGTRYLSPSYMPASILSEGARSAHNSLMGILVDYGIVGLSIYLLLYAKMMLRLRRITRALKPHEIEFGAMLAGIGGALGVVFASGQASNYYYAEIQYWLLALVTVAASIYARGAHQDRRRDIDRSAQSSLHSDTKDLQRVN